MLNDKPAPIKWEQGEHVCVIGDTGSGKTFLIRELIALRDYVLFIRTKADPLPLPGFTLARKADAMDDPRNARILLEPKRHARAREIWRAMRKAWDQGRWTIVFDELYYIDAILRMGDEVNEFLTQGRSGKFTAVVGMQRPVAITRFAISQSTHAFVSLTEGRDTITISQALTPRLKPVVGNLSHHEFAYFHRPSRYIARLYAQQLSEVLVKG